MGLIPSVCTDTFISEYDLNQPFACLVLDCSILGMFCDEATYVFGSILQCKALGHMSQVQVFHVKYVFQLGRVGGIGSDKTLVGCIKLKTRMCQRKNGYYILRC